MNRAEVDEGGKYLKASQEENVCEYLWVLLVNSVLTQQYNLNLI